MDRFRHLAPLFLASLWLIFVDAALAGDRFSGKVVRIVDGDTLVILVNKEQIKIRLAQIDTPERGQPWASRAKQALSALAFSKAATVVPVTVDRYGRTIGEVFVEGLHVNRQMVTDGDAWVYRKYATDDSLFDLENEARAGNRGLWALPEADRVPPWEWRRRGR